MKTISNMLVESYEDRLANLQKEFGDVQVTDLDAKDRAPASSDEVPHAKPVETLRPKVNVTSAESSNDVNQTAYGARDPPSSPSHIGGVPRADAEASQEQPSRSNSVQRRLSRQPNPISAVTTPVITPSTQDPPPMELHFQERSARHTQGYYLAHHNQRAQSPSSRLATHLGPNPLTYESQGGSHVMLEFADPTASPMVSPNTENKATRPPAIRDQRLPRQYGYF
ncbi:hypothetical protein E8E12_000937 [Didymella heteroderae]|uniref:Uncharacterized protein n=1 Tax=Didymella heteroderae TaxID=1769908 RepID=A0A9P5BVB9_9PLEO|nr:hypothetical protein E8E12_000937 [Didymella heteroderae]